MHYPPAPAWSEEVLCDHRSQGSPAVTHVRGTVLISSLQMLKQMGLYERYLENLAKTWRDEVLFAIALSWVPVVVADAHYAACDALRLGAHELTRLARRSRVDRFAYCAYYRGLAKLLSRTAYVKLVPSRDGRADTFALLGSWV